jgi:putative methyltransferase (TIGR04325 family)
MTNLAGSIFRSRAMRRTMTKLEEKLPLVRAWHRFEYERHFSAESRTERMFAGVYHSQEEALRAVPAGCRVGHDHPEVADRHIAEIGHVWPSDYPVLFWMSQLMAEGRSIFDFGGNVGLQFYNFQKYLKYPARLSWKVCEVPSVVQRGLELARLKHAVGLSFTSNFEDANGSDILLASSSLQFIPNPWWSSLSSLRLKPHHLVINRTPLCDGPSFITLHNIGPAFCTYQIRNRGAFIKELSTLGYRLQDAWEAAEFSCYIPFHPDREVKAYTGMYFQLTD